MWCSSKYSNDVTDAIVSGSQQFLVVCRFLLDAEIEEVSANLKTLLKELPVRPFMLCDNPCSGSQFCLIPPDALEGTLWKERAACQLCGDLGCACRQDEAGTPRKVTSDDYACLQLKLVPRASLQLGPAWASQDGHISAHATLASRGKARVDNQLIFSGTKGAVIISTSQGSLTVTDEAGKVRLGCNTGSLPCFPRSTIF